MLSVNGTARLTKTPEIRFTAKGTAVCHLSVATNEFVKGQDKKVASFFDITVFGKAAEWLGANLNKGERVEVHGRLRQSRFERKDGSKGQNVFVLAQSIQRLDWKNGNGNGTGNGAAAEKDAGVVTGDEPSVDEDIPF